MRIRRYRKGDSEHIIRMIDRVMKEFGECVDAQLDRDLLDIPKYYGNKGAFWVLTDGKKIVGSIAVSRITDDVCKFRRFYLLKEYRGQGWGTKLFNIRMRFAKRRGYKEAWAVTSKPHEIAVKFIKKMGGEFSKKRLFPTKRAHMFFKYKIQNGKKSKK